MEIISGYPYKVCWDYEPFTMNELISDISNITNDFKLVYNPKNLTLDLFFKDIDHCLQVKLMIV